jgi:uncharacterized protein YecE (DUF72 family)
MFPQGGDRRKLLATAGSLARSGVMPPQLSLFGPRDPLAAVYADAAALAARLPPEVYFGTSSWSFPGWQGIVYADAQSEAALAREGLAEYARHPLLRTVGIDRGYYAPIPADDFGRYAAQLPAGFRCCIKAPAAVTSAIVPGSDRAGRAVENEGFLSPARFASQLGDAILARFLPHTAMVYLEMPAVPAHLRPTPAALAERLDAFLAAAPKEIPFAVELRDPTLFSRAYTEALARHGAAHVYNHWSGVPTLARQAQRVDVRAQPFVAIRLLLPRGARYEERKRALAPFDALKDPDPEMRAQTVDLVRAAVAAGKRVWVIVNNKAEGSSPLTVRALAEALAR